MHRLIFDEIYERNLGVTTRDGAHCSFDAAALAGAALSFRFSESLSALPASTLAARYYLDTFGDSSQIRNFVRICSCPQKGAPLAGVPAGWSLLFQLPSVFAHSLERKQSGRATVGRRPALRAGLSTVARECRLGSWGRSELREQRRVPRGTRRLLQRFLPESRRYPASGAGLEASHSLWSFFLERE